MARLRRVGVVGSREYADLDRVRQYVAELIHRNRGRYRTFVVVSGGAGGVDTVAIETAQKMRAPWEVLHAEWRRFGRSAGPIRNEKLVHYVDDVVAFWDGWSSGTRHTIEIAHAAGKLRWLESDLNCHGQDANGACLGPPCWECCENTCLTGWSVDGHHRRYHEACG